MPANVFAPQDDRPTVVLVHGAFAGFILEPGESTGELAVRFPGGELGPALAPIPYVAGAESGDDLCIEQDKFRAVFAADVPEDVAALMAATQRPIAAAALENKVRQAGWKNIPSTLVTLEDLAVPAESQRFMATRAQSHAVEIAASHAVTVSEPGAVTDLILAAVRGTAR